MGSPQADAAPVLFCGSLQALGGLGPLSAQKENKPEGLLQVETW